MDNLKKYNDIFCEVFGVTETELNSDFTNRSVEAWDSIGHMNLISSIEEEFDVMLDEEDIMKFVSYAKGIQIMKKYKVEIGE